jgi:predicted transposase/invertase (TIGR01784 family)
MTDPRNDRIFKQIFHHHPRSLMHLLNAFLPLQDPIVEVEYMPEELQTESDGYLMSFVDVRCRDGAGRHFIVEMQMQKAPLFNRRVVMNACRIYGRQARPGSDLSEIQPVYTLCLLDYTLYPGHSSWVHHFEPRTDSTPFHSLGELRFTFVEIRKWLEFGKFDEENIRDGWMLFFTQPEKVMDIYTPEQRQRLNEMMEAVNAWDLTRYSERDLWIMDKKIDNMMTHEMFVRQYREEERQLGVEEGREQGVQQGMEQGVQQGMEQGLQQGMEQGVDRTVSALQYLVLHPEASDSAVAERFGLSMAVIAGMRTTLGK